MGGNNNTIFMPAATFKVPPKHYLELGVALWAPSN
jgi:hypothetical protein